MCKRRFLSVILSLVILLSFTSVGSPSALMENAGTTSTDTAQMLSQLNTIEVATEPAIMTTAEPTVTITTEPIESVFIEPTDKTDDMLITMMSDEVVVAEASNTLACTITWTRKL